VKVLPGETLSRTALVQRWLTGTFAGRALIAGAVLKLITAALESVLGPDGALVSLLDVVGGISLVIGTVAAAYRLSIAAKRRLLWRVRRKLTLSYIFIGFVPALLIITFFLLCGVVLFNNVSSYLMQARIRALLDQTRFLAQGAALELERTTSRSEMEALIARRQAASALRYPGVSYAIVPAKRTCSNGTDAPRTATPPLTAAVTAGPWEHLDPPAALPDWVPCAGHASAIAYREVIETSDEPRTGPTHFGLRAAALPDTVAPRYAVIVDLPVGPDIVHRLRDETGVELGAITAVGGSATRVRPVDGRPSPAADPAAVAGSNATRQSFPQSIPWVAFLDFTDWLTGRTGTLTVSLGISIADLYGRISETPGIRTGQILLTAVAFVGILFLVIQFVAFVTGLALAKSITGSVHELFIGTERVQQHDFKHKIPIRSHDQLGDLARSFNEMTTSIEDLLQQKAEKERLEQELKIARKIQMSLLPQGPLLMPGLALTAHCEPAREVGGDYYDFLPLDEHRLGLLIADVSGKGTSAALYMAELKGLILSLSQLHKSPRELLIDANRIISNHLDTRSFITMTYAVVDMRARTLTYARAGHCPLIYLPGSHAAARSVKILAPDGLVLGLKIDKGEMFERLLQEESLPLGPGDLFVFFTDGISEAMSPADECFGEGRLGQLVQEHGNLPFEQLRERILREIRAFQGSASQHDDMTMLLVKVDEAAPGEGPHLETVGASVQRGPNTP